MTSIGFHRSKYDSCVYFCGSNQERTAYLLLYVDDMLIANKHKSKIDKLKNLLNKEFEMKNLGNAKRILGMEIFRNRAGGTLFLSQKRYIRNVLERFDMLNCKPVLTPLCAHFNLSMAQSSNIKAQVDEFPYA